MRIERHPEHLAAVFTPESGDDPEDLEDAIHDELLRAERAGSAGEVANVILDLSQVPSPPSWLKACGPQVPDANLRIVLGDAGYAAARLLNLTAVFEWYPSVEAALRQGV